MIYDKDLKRFRFVLALAVVIMAIIGVIQFSAHHWVDGIASFFLAGSMILNRSVLRHVQQSRDLLRLVHAITAEQES
jgi:hypothetical protein